MYLVLVCNRFLLVLVVVVGCCSTATTGTSTTLGTSVGTSVGTSTPSTTLTTCQCGVFLLGSPPLTYSPDAQPALAGNPVGADCSDLSDRTRCSTSCRSLIGGLSGGAEAPLVQTVILAATRALACQHLNSSSKVPLPRLHTNTYTPQGAGGKGVSEPKWLGGFYRWCDSSWIYAGVSVPKPLCCSTSSGSSSGSTVSSSRPVKCLEEVEESSSLNSRSPRLIIKKRPEDDLSSEENELDLATTTTTTTSTTTTTDSSMEVVGESIIAVASTSGSKPAVAGAASPLNVTILAEAFQIVGALMRSMGLSDVVEGIGTVLPGSTATELLRRVDVGGWVGKYQDKYVVYGREFNMGYCYLEYGLYNVASEGGVGTILSRVFGKQTSGSSVVHQGTSGIHQGPPNIIQQPPPSMLPANQPIQHNHISSASAHINNNGMLLNTRRVRAVSTTGTTTGTKPVQNGVPTVVPANKPLLQPRQATPSNNNGPNLMNMANMLLQLAGTGDGGGGDGMNSLLQSALPLMGQVASSPMIQGVVSNLVTSFLTPPDNNVGGSSPSHQQQRPVTRPQQQQQPNRPSGSSEESSVLPAMLGQIVQTYIKHYFSGSSKPVSSPPSPPPPRVPSEKSPSSVVTTPLDERTDIVDTMCEVAKPFFISYFGVVPGLPGFGQLNIAERTGRVRSEDTLTYDPDPGTSLSDLLFGSVNLPSTGNGLFDFGNRVAFAFSRANDPTQGMYCFKQYSVNKLWDSFRFGVKTIFK